MEQHGFWGEAVEGDPVAIAEVEAMGLDGWSQEVGELAVSPSTLLGRWASRNQGWRKMSLGLGQRHWLAPGLVGRGQANLGSPRVLSHSENASLLFKGEKCRSFIDLAPASEKGECGPSSAVAAPPSLGTSFLPWWLPKAL